MPEVSKPHSERLCGRCNQPYDGESAHGPGHCEKYGRPLVWTDSGGSEVVSAEGYRRLEEQLEAAQEALREIADAPGLEFFNAPEVARRALECVCAEINTRHCPVHGQDSNPASEPEAS